jgi:hypothetical protein
VLDGCGIQAKGLLTEVSYYENQKTRRITYSMHVVTPRSTPLKVAIKEGVDPSLYRDKVGQVIGFKFVVRENKFGTFFEEV